MQESKPKAKGKFLALEPWEQYQYRYALILEYRADRAYQHIIERELKPLWRALPASAYVVTPPEPRALPASEYRTPPTLLPGFDPAPLPLDWWGLKNRLFYGDPNPRLAEYIDAVDNFVRSRMRLTQGGEPAYWAVEFVHAEITAGEYGPLDPSTGMNYRIFEATIRLAVSPARASVRLTVPYDPASEGREPTGREHEFGGWNLEAARWNSFEEWDQLEALVLELYRAWAANMRAFWGQHYQYRYAGTMEERHKDIQRLFRYLFHRDVIDIIDRANRLRMKRMADTLMIDLPKHAQKRRPK